MILLLKFVFWIGLALVLDSILFYSFLFITLIPFVIAIFIIFDVGGLFDKYFRTCYFILNIPIDFFANEHSRAFICSLMTPSFKYDDEKQDLYVRTKKDCLKVEKFPWWLPQRINCVLFDPKDINVEAHIDINVDTIYFEEGQTVKLTLDNKRIRRLIIPSLSEDDTLVIKNVSKKFFIEHSHTAVKSNSPLHNLLKKYGRMILLEIKEDNALIDL